MALDFSDAAISKALEDVRNGTDGINWCVSFYCEADAVKN
jgi:hypothetical protein